MPGVPVPVEPSPKSQAYPVMVPSESRDPEVSSVAVRPMLVAVNAAVGATFGGGGGGTVANGILCHCRTAEVSTTVKRVHSLVPPWIVTREKFGTLEGSP